MKTATSFIDLCAGCGGLSLGLMAAGWRGLFAVEKDALAFSTLKHNLIEGSQVRFKWPAWLPREAISIEALLSNHEKDLQALCGTVQLLAGGPPCQGFSSIGRRLAHDPRNQVFKHYVKLVKLLEPGAVLMENVRGILHPFTKSISASTSESDKSPIYADLIKEALDALDYHVWPAIIHAKDYGIPQTRPRFILIGLRREGRAELAALDPFTTMQRLRPIFLLRKGLGTDPVTVKEAISDLCTPSTRLVDCVDTPGYKQGTYGKQTSTYQVLLHGEKNGGPADSHRFAKHLPTTAAKFEWLHENCKKGKRLEPRERGKYENKKQYIYILDPNGLAPTVTTLPDDLLHYSEPRILTVREMARLQSFPDWFEFKGKYTTGGRLRTKQCPRYTQVGNAVPPLLAELLGETLIDFLNEVENAK
ncbi:MAG: DNA cytosine methyltransferase [Limisphaerales bacterium]